jgi:hypothetical protein
LQLQQHERAFEDRGIQIVVVTFETTPFVRAYIAETKFTWPILIDHERTRYRHYGMHRGHLWDIWGLRTWWAYAKELAQGQVPKYSGADTRQLGGDVLVDPSGVVRFHHVGSGPADRPPVATILEAREQQA